MNLLLLTPQLPYPPHQGTSLRNFHIIRGLAAEHEITLLSFLEEGQTVHNAPLTELCRHIETVRAPARSTAQRLRQLLTTRLPDMAHRLYRPTFADQLRQLLATNRFDVVQIEGIELARYLDVIRVASKGVKIVFDNHNAETELQRRNMQTDWRQPRRWPAATYSWVQVGRLAHFERWACESADWVTAVSETDKLHLQSLTTHVPISVIPNCIDITEYQDLPLPIPFDLVFSGKMDYRPNVDAALWFADEVWPQILAARPFTTWAIVGQKPHARLERLRDVPGITVTGWVADVRPYLAGARVFIMPFRVGSGTRLKLIEAMAAGKPIVSTRVGAEGFPVVDGRELVLANSAQEMGTAVLRLLNDPAECTRLGAAARQFAAAYDWRVVIPKFNQIYEKLILTAGE
ncbi:MAG: glycosyltransferase [Chloroflexi bacterium]|nr:glycosyltransferase [Ardenticatenaceae bacterium]NOG33758.1 glycosyltransferase [Chloroflexota bacterium]GIK54341.1 MAG: glycosyl transferase family 1 [Chloroflexota bacterium]